MPMERVFWVIQVPLTQSDQWFDLCECWNSESVGRIVEHLLEAEKNAPAYVRVEKRVYIQ